MAHKQNELSLNNIKEIDKDQNYFWQGMPEFHQEKKEPHAKIIFRFENEEDLQEFAETIGQKLTSKTKSSWYPFKPHRREVKEVWISQ
jgi:tRNA U34 2-thiouridine synthase MnmA/TrmU